MNESKRTLCENQSCGCPPEEGARHCSPYCANVDHHEDDGEERACACGHEPCIDSRRVRREKQAVTTSIGRGPGSQPSS